MIKFCHFAILYLTGVASALSRKQQAAEQNRRRVSTPVHKKPQPIQEEEEIDDDELSDECPEPNGFFSDAEQCDKYYDCRDGKYTEKLCPDGLVFNDYSPQHEKCDLPFGIDCSKRPKLRRFRIYIICIFLNFYSLIFCKLIKQG